MSQGGKFSIYEGVLFTTVIIMSKILYTSPSVVIKQVGTAGWYTTIISCITTMVFFLFLCTLMKRFPGKSLVKVYEAVIGKFLGKVSGILFFMYILYYSVVNLREFVEMIKVNNLPDTPTSLILMTFVAVTLLIAYKGIEGIVRICCINFYPITFAILIILILAFPYYNFDYLKPYFGYGFKNTLITGFTRSATYEEIMILPIIIVSLHSIKDFKKIGIVSLAIAGVIFSASLISYLSAFQYTGGKESMSALFQLSRIIYFNRYFQRIETIFLFAWVTSVLLTVSTGFYASIRVYCQVFEIKEYRPILPPFALLMYVLALIPRNISEVIEIHLRAVRQLSFIPVYGTPLLILTIAIVLRKKDQEKSA